MRLDLLAMKLSLATLEVTSCSWSVVDVRSKYGRSAPYLITSESCVLISDPDIVNRRCSVRGGPSCGLII
jgi:hypothetical protein